MWMNVNTYTDMCCIHYYMWKLIKQRMNWALSMISFYWHFVVYFEYSLEIVKQIIL